MAPMASLSESGFVGAFRPEGADREIGFPGRGPFGPTASSGRSALAAVADADLLALARSAAARGADRGRARDTLAPGLSDKLPGARLGAVLWVVL